MNLNTLKIFTTTLLLILCAGIASAQTTISGGSVKGTWTKANSPYKITGNIRIDAGDTLKIEPGVKVEFSDKVGVYVRGSLKANGAAGDSIDFSVAPITNYHNLWETTSYGWRGFVFLGDLPDTDTTEFSFCKFSYVNKTDTNGCMFFGAAVGFQSDSTRFISECLSLISYSHRYFNIKNSYFFSSRGPGSAIMIRRGGAKISSCKFENLSAENPIPMPAPGVAGIWSADQSIFPNPTKYYESSINGCLFKSLHGGAFACHNNRSTRVTNIVIDNPRNVVLGDNAFLQVFGTISEVNIDGLEIKNCNDSVYSLASFINIRRPGVTMNNIRIHDIKLYEKFSTTGYFRSPLIQLDFLNEGSIEMNNIKISNIKKIYPSNYSTTTAGPIRFEAIASTNEKAKIILNNFSITNAVNGIAANNRLSMTNGIIANCDSFGIFFDKGGIRASNLLVANNGGYGIRLVAQDPGDVSRAYISNSIITGNRGGNWPTGGQVSYTDQSQITFKNCIIENGKAGFMFNNHNGQTNYKADTIKCITGVPDFVNPTAGAGRAFDASTADWHLKSECAGTSIGFNAGTDTLANDIFQFGSTFSLPATDLEGNPRISCGKVDIGPYELQSYTQGIITGALIDSSATCPGDTLSAFLSTDICTSPSSTYQWQVQANGSGMFSDVAGATQSSLTLENIQQGWSKNNYRLKITNPTCSKVDYTPASLLHVKQGPQFSLPNDTSVCSNLTLQATAGVALVNPLWSDGSNALNRSFSGTPTRTISITASSAEGCIGSDSFVLTSKPAPNISLGNDTSLTNNQSIELKVANTYPQYIWEDNSTNAIRTIQNDTQNLGDQLYWLEVTASNGCKDRDSIIITFKKTDNIEQLNKVQMGLYPNPNKGVFSIKLPNAGEVIISNLSGKVLWEQNMEQGIWKVDQNTLPKGMYLLQWQGEGQQSSTLRFVVE